MPLPSPKKSVFALTFLVAFYLACANMQLDQTRQRFNDNMNGTLSGFPDFSPASPTNFSFSAMGDTHIGSPSGGNVMARALQLSKNDGDSFVLLAGDNTNTGFESEILAFQTQITNSGLRAYPAIGNHDIFFGGWGNYKRLIGRSIYSFNAGNVHFIVLDTANGTFGEDQFNWLRADLVSNTRPLKIVMTHFPIYMGEFSSLYKLSSDEEATVFKDVMNEFGVNLVIGGHYHGYGDKTLGATRYLVTGACNNILDIGNRAMYIKVTINGTTITTRQIDL
jgi:predicted phosphodiesterase